MSKQVLKVTSDLKNLESICRFVAGAASDMGMDDDTLYDLQLAVDEACTNVIDYAYQGRSGLPLTVECAEEDGKCVVVIRDCGRPFDPARVQAPDLTSPLSRRQVGGLGIYLMRKLMDDVRFRFDAGTGNELTMTKAIRPGVPKTSTGRA
jgi:anti-sigma regulatory factor (Ser/Thr protein kinase)